MLVQRIIDLRIANGEGVGPPAEEPKPQDEEISGARRLAQKCRPRHWFRATRVDVLSRILFPLLFISFNIYYWLRYTTANKSAPTATH